MGQLQGILFSDIYMVKSCKGKTVLPFTDVHSCYYIVQIVMLSFSSLNYNFIM